MKTEIQHLEIKPSYRRQHAFAFFLILLFAALTVLSWYEAAYKNEYSFKLAALAPAGLFCACLALLFPKIMGKPNTTGEKCTALLVFGAGALLGLFNWHLIASGYFQR